MESTLGNALRFYKEQLNVNSIDVYKGICSASTYSNLETGRKEKDFFVQPSPLPDYESGKIYC